MNTHPFQSRISYKGDLSKLLGEVVKVYDFGKYLSHSVIGIGYEDLNVVLETSSGKYLVKFLADFRSKEDCLRYAEIMQAVLAAKIAHPKLYKSKQGFYTEITLDEVLVRLLVFDFIEGKTFYELKQKPSDHERDFLVREAAKINQIKISPSFVYDSWAIVNFEKEFNSIKNKIDNKDLALIQPVMEEFSQLSLEDLPHCFVHGDIIDTNVIKANSGELFVLDFSVSNVYPRIQELAILLCDIFFYYERRGDFEILYEIDDGELSKAEIEKFLDKVDAVENWSLQKVREF